MDFAADAVIDVVAPPPARTPARAPEPSGPSFDEHLEAATRDEPRPPAQANESKNSEIAASNVSSEADAAAHADNKVDAPVEAETESNESAVCAPPPAPAQQPQTTAPILTLQFIDLEGGPDEAPTTSGESAEPAPAQSAPQLPAAPTTARKQDGAATPAPVFAEEDAASAEAGETFAPTIEAAAPDAEPTQPTRAQAPTPSPPHSTVMTAEIEAQLTAQGAPKSQAPPPDQQAQDGAPVAAPITRAAAPETAKQTQAKMQAEPEAKADGDTAKTAEVNAGAQKTAPAKGGGNAQGKSAEVTPFVVTEAGPSSNSAPAQTAHASALQLTTSTTQAAQAQHAVLDQAAARTPPAGAQVAREIVRRFDGDSTRFELRLDPPELGRVEVRLEVSRDHRVTAVVAADSPQALTELARHARDLEQSLQAAGLELADNGLSFDLRQSQDEAHEAGESGGRNSTHAGEDANAESAPILARPIGLERWRGVRVDVMV